MVRSISILIEYQGSVTPRNRGCEEMDQPEVSPEDQEQIDDSTKWTSSTEASSSAATVAPGSRDAIERGCCCSALANAAYRTGARDASPFIDPECPVHKP